MRRDADSTRIFIVDEVLSAKAAMSPAAVSDPTAWLPTQVNCCGFKTM